MSCITGDKLQRNSIYLGDCLALLPAIEPGTVDMVLCDLPYGTTQNKWDTVIPLEPLWREWLRVCKPNAAIVLTSAQPFTTHLIGSNLPMFRYAWVWDKCNSTGFLNAKKQPLRQTEDVCVFYRSQPIYNPQMEVRGKPRKKGGYIKPDGSDNYGTYQDSVTTNNEYYPTNLLIMSNADRKAKTHPTQKPVALFEYLIKTYTNPGDVVLDNCIGSGTTAVAAKNTGRDYIGVELDPAYYQQAVERVAA